MKVTNANEVKIYDVSAGKSMPQWLSDRQKRKLQQRDNELRQRIELIQDFKMPESSGKIKTSRDGEYVMSTGVYPPRVRCYQTKELSMKFERYLTSEVVQFEILSEDYTKMVFLEADRTVEFHAQYGSHFKIRIPKFGRDMVYHSPSAELYIGGSSSEVYRLNLDQGRFLQPYQTLASSVNACDVNPAHQLLSFGTEDGTVESWDPRQRRRVGVLEILPSLISAQLEELDFVGDSLHVTCVSSASDGLSLAVGTSSGHVFMYDIRAKRPLFVKDHQYGFPIKNIKFHGASGKVFSTDKKIVKVWEKSDGSPYTSIEPDCDINDLSLVGNSGLFFLAVEHPQIRSYYIPSLGLAPNWCSFLDNITEELEESKPSDDLFDDYKFVTKKELQELGLDHLIGTNLVRAYMHGYFMDIRLYSKAKMIVNPFAYEEYKQKKIQQKIEEKRSNRIQAVRKVPKVNSQYAKQLYQEERLLESHQLSGKNLKNAHDRVSTLHDPRFKNLFENPDFEVDTKSEAFLLNNPSGKRFQDDDLSFQFEQIHDDDDDDEKEGRPSDESSSSQEEEEEEEDSRDAKVAQLKEGNQGKVQKDSGRKTTGKKFYELKSGHEYQPKLCGKDRKRISLKPLGERLHKERLDPQSLKLLSKGGVGNMEYTFITEKKQKETERFRQKQRDHQTERRNGRRGVKELGLKSSENKFWRGRKVKP